jgi:glycerol kinase
MAWLRRAGVTGGVVTTSDTWLIHRLTGEFVTDRATASRSMLVKLDEEDWSDELLDLFGLGSESMPRIVGCDEVVGTTQEFGGAVPVGGLIVDQPAALFAQGCLSPGDVKCTYGTGAFLLANTGSGMVPPEGSLTASVAWRARGLTTRCLDGQVYTAGSAIRWLQDTGLVGSPEQLDALGVDDSDGVLCVPALAGLGGPWWRPDATASFTGLRLSTTREHMVLAVLEGIAAQVAELCRRAGAHLQQPLSRLRVDGGLTRSDRLMQAQADLAQLPVELFPSAHATAVGAAGFARLALDQSLSVEEAIGEVGPARTFQPKWTADRAEEHLARWRSAADRNLVMENDR